MTPVTEAYMHDLAVVCRIQSITPIEGRDRIELCRIVNYNSIVQKNQFREGELAIYIFYDSVLPVRPEFEFLRKRCYSPRLDGFRIKPMRMGNVISEGLVLPLSILCRPAGEGEVVTGELGIRQYEPPEERISYKNIPRKGLISLLMKIPAFEKWYLLRSRRRREYPETIPKSDEENIERKWDSVAADNAAEYIVTEKMEGQAATYYLRSRKYHVCSHNYEVDRKSGSWGAVSEELDIERILKRIKRQTGRDLAIQGEICGPGIQKNIYGFDKLHFFVYGGYEVVSGRRLAFSELKNICNEYELEMVPFIKRSHLLSSCDEMLSDAEGTSIYGASVPREGCVWRTESGDVHFKCKSRPYKIWFAE